jgi:hypothetical protein
MELNLVLGLFLVVVGSKELAMPLIYSIKNDVELNVLQEYFLTIMAKVSTSGHSI